jgi:hypothetical protein
MPLHLLSVYLALSLESLSLIATFDFPKPPTPGCGGKQQQVSIRHRETTMLY